MKKNILEIFSKHFMEERDSVIKFLANARIDDKADISKIKVNSENSELSISMSTLYQLLAAEQRHGSKLNTQNTSMLWYYNTYSNGSTNEWYDLQNNYYLLNGFDLSITLQFLLNNIDFSKLEDEEFFAFIKFLPSATFASTNFDNFSFSKKVIIIYKFPELINHIKGKDRAEFQAYYLMAEYNASLYKIVNLEDPDPKLLKYVLKEIFKSPAPIVDDIRKIKKTNWWADIENKLGILNYAKNTKIKLPKSLEDLINTRINEINETKASLALCESLHLSTETNN